MTISVVVTTYNRASLLRTTLAYLRRQQFAPGDEVIVVDNGSTDDTAAVIAKEQSGFPVPLIDRHERTPGKTPALNTGIAGASGEILAFTDDDVLVADDWIATIRSLFSDPQRALVGGRVDPMWERPAPRWLRVEEGDGYGRMAAPLALLHYGKAQDLLERTAVGANLVVRRTVHDAVRGFAAHLGRRRGTLLCGEDHDFCTRVAAAGYRCEYRPELRVRHHVPAARTSLRYYVRWFFWSGVTHALLDTTAERVTGAMIPRYWIRQLATTPGAALWHFARQRHPEAASQLIEVAFACGYLIQRIRGWREPPPVTEPVVQKT